MQSIKADIPYSSFADSVDKVLSKTAMKNYLLGSASMSQEARSGLQFVLRPVFDPHVRFGSSGWCAVLLRQVIRGVAVETCAPGCAESPRIVRDEESCIDEKVGPCLRSRVSALSRVSG